LRRAPKQICLSEIIYLSGGLLAPFGDAEELRSLIHQDVARLLCQVFLDVRNAAARSLDNVTLADIVSGEDSPRLKRKRLRKRKDDPTSLFPMVGGGASRRKE
jgi:DNA-binding IscR family transcriptional regulator